jgi:N-acetylmuramoyl-L-alanine amidase
MPCGKRRHSGLRIAALLVAIVALFVCVAIQSPNQPAATPQTSVQQPPQPEVQQPPGQPAQPQPTPETHAHTQPEFLVVIDPGHGGDDPGASLGDKVEEKDVTLSLARRIRADLQERGIVARLLRNEDETIDLEQRAEVANAQRASVYLAIHAGTPGTGVRVYTAAMTSPTSDPGKFLPWDEAQLPYLARSRALSKAVASELEKKGMDALSLVTPLRPLNNISAPAIAIELACDRETIQQVLSQKFQSTVASAVTSQVAQLRPQEQAQ